MENNNLHSWATWLNVLKHSLITFLKNSSSSRCVRHALIYWLESSGHTYRIDVDNIYFLTLLLFKCSGHIEKSCCGGVVAIPCHTPAGQGQSCIEYKLPHRAQVTAKSAETQEKNFTLSLSFTWVLCWFEGLCSASWLQCLPCYSRSDPLFSSRCCYPGRWLARCPENAGVSRRGTKTEGPIEGGVTSMWVNKRSGEDCSGKRKEAREARRWHLANSALTWLYMLFAWIIHNMCSDIDTAPTMLTEEQ